MTSNRKGVLLKNAAIYNACILIFSILSSFFLYDFSKNIDFNSRLEKVLNSKSLIVSSALNCYFKNGHIYITILGLVLIISIFYFYVSPVHFKKKYLELFLVISSFIVSLEIFLENRNKQILFNLNSNNNITEFIFDKKIREERGNIELLELLKNKKIYTVMNTRIETFLFYHDLSSNIVPNVKDLRFDSKKDLTYIGSYYFLPISFYSQKSKQELQQALKIIILPFNEQKPRKLSDELTFIINPF